MPLWVDDIEQARVAYHALEGRAQSAERYAQVLSDMLKELRRPGIPDDGDGSLLRQRIATLEGENIKLRGQLDALLKRRADILLQDLIASVGMAAAIGESTMPDRAISTLAMAIQSYVAPAGTGGVGLRFQPPELSTAADGLATTSFELAKVPPAAGSPAPPNLTTVLEAKQQVFTALVPRFPAAAAVAARVSMILSDAAHWSFPYLAGQAVEVAAAESDLVPLIAAAAPPATTLAFQNAVAALAALAASLVAKVRPVVADLYALSAALDATTAAVRNLSS
jgi:hypothetical protein